MTDDSARASTRDTVLAAIRTAPVPPTVEEIARDLGLHHNSVRLHTAALRDAGLIAQGSRPGGGRGRPQVTYRTTDRGAWTGPRDYRLLASLLLTDRVGGDHADARRLGVEWGRRLAAASPRGGGDDDDTTGTTDYVVATLDELGFEPTPVPAAPPAAASAASPASATTAGRVELRNCPFLDLVDQQDGAVCAIHAGMLDGLVEGRRTGVELLPFTSPRACTVRIAPSTAESPSRSA